MTQRFWPGCCLSQHLGDGALRRRNGAAGTKFYGKTNANLEQYSREEFSPCPLCVSVRLTLHKKSWYDDDDDDDHLTNCSWQWAVLDLSATSADLCLSLSLWSSLGSVVMFDNTGEEIEVVKVADNWTLNSWLERLSFLSSVFWHQGIYFFTFFFITRIQLITGFNFWNMV